MNTLANPWVWKNVQTKKIERKLKTKLVTDQPLYTIRGQV